MLLAEIHGKYNEAVQNDEDYLTSTVFGHLRYVQPGPFWMALFSKAKTVPMHREEKTLTAVLGTDCDLTVYEKLDVTFWPKCPKLGEPELALCFSGGGQQPVVILVEVKLWAAKSGYGKSDQLMRYLKIADSIHLLTPSVPPQAKVVVLYLTPRESLSEIEESLSETSDPNRSRLQLFRLQWQDMIKAIGIAIHSESVLAQLILDDVKQFLRARRLEYFDGFHVPPGTESMSDRCGSFYTPLRAFGGFTKIEDLALIQVMKAAW